MNQPLAPLGVRRRALNNTSLPRAGSIGLRMLAAVALVGGSLALTGIAGSAAATAATGTCDGVIVVVDSTDLGGELNVGCAEGDQPTGRNALTAAGFTATDSQPGFLCAINSMPDPCPETFDGSFWSYWYSTPDGEWTSYQVGADSSTPATGELEGWRYNDGATPPGIAPADAAAALPEPSPEASETPNASAPGADEQVTSSPDGAAERLASQNLMLILTSVGFVAVIAAVILAFVVRRRRNGVNAAPSEVRD
ncbi:MAG: hypothetical protein IT190_01020 [Microbacteriaceae bacterium]|nr:hypothetical protein [Microbacteriaceae bacterium]